MKIEVTSCADCPLCANENYCTVGEKFVGRWYDRETRPDWCPLPLEVVVKGKEES